MANIFQGEANPATVSTIEKQTTAPEFYTNYLQDIANLGQAGVQQSGIAGMSPLQQQALNMAPQSSFAGMGSMAQGAQLAGAAGTTAAPDILQSYMNPYTRNVVDEMSRLQNRNIQENVIPGINAASVGTGQFGSQRQAQVAGNTMRDMQADLLGKQYGALNTGFNTATTAAQADLQRQMQAGQALGQIGSQEQAAGSSGLTSLYNMGAKEQELAQRQLDLPMNQANAYAQLLKNYTIPTGEVQQTTGSTGYQNSPLSQITGLMTALGSMNKSADGGLQSSSTSASVPRGASYHDGQGNFYDANGYLVGQ